MRLVSRRSFGGLPWWSILPAPTARGTGLIPGQGIKIPHASQCGKKKRMLFGSQTWSWPWQPRSHTGVTRGFSGWMDGHVVALLPQSQTPTHPFIQTSPLFSTLLFLKPGASYFLSLKSPTPQPVPGPIMPTQPSATQMPDTYTFSSVQFSRSVVSDSL